MSSTPQPRGVDIPGIPSSGGNVSSRFSRFLKGGLELFGIFIFQGRCFKVFLLFDFIFIILNAVKLKVKPKAAPREAENCNRLSLKNSKKLFPPKKHSFFAFGYS